MVLALNPGIACEVPGDVRLGVGLAGPVSVDFMREYLGSVTSISLDQQLQLCEQIRPYDNSVVKGTNHQVRQNVLCLRRSVPEIHQHVIGTIINQQFYR